MIISREKNILIYINEKQYIEYIDINTLNFVKKEDNKVTFNSKFETDLFYLKK